MCELTGTAQVAALKGYAYANATALALWEEVYPDALQLALTDTFSTNVFFKVTSSPCLLSRLADWWRQDFVAHPDRARRWKGLRQDSGDPFIYAPRAKEVYESLGIDSHEKTIIFSDALSVEKAKKLKAQCDEVGFIGECTLVACSRLLSPYTSIIWDWDIIHK